MSDLPKHSVSVSAVVSDDDGKVLVAQRRDNGKWQLPGGVLELDESIHQGVRREVLEETGVLVEPERLTGVYKDLTLGVVALVFRARVVHGEPRPTEESAQNGGHRRPSRNGWTRRSRYASSTRSTATTPPSGYMTVYTCCRMSRRRRPRVKSTPEVAWAGVQGGTGCGTARGSLRLAR